MFVHKKNETLTSLLAEVCPTNFYNPPPNTHFIWSPARGWEWDGGTNKAQRRRGAKKARINTDTWLKCTAFRLSLKMVVAAVAGHVVAKMVVVKHVVAGLRGQHLLRVAKRKIISFPTALPITVHYLVSTQISRKYPFGRSLANRVWNKLKKTQL